MYFPMLRFFGRHLLLLQPVSKNMFDHLPSLTARSDSPTFADELERYLNTDPEPTPDVILWWTERHNMYPCLSRMALGYHTIPGK
jgi:hAT family C-terminal dimerisation region